MVKCKRNIRNMAKKIAVNPFIIGIIVGCLVGLYTRTFQNIPIPANFQTSKQTHAQDNLESSNYEPKHIPLKNVKWEPNKFKRPRFIRDELNITKKILVVVTSSKEGGLNERTSFLNETLSPYVDDIIFFIDSENDDDNENSAFETNKGSNIISIPKLPKTIRIFKIIKYISDNYAKKYQLFLLIPDTVIVHGPSFQRYYSQFTMPEHAYLGVRINKDESTCDVDGGILVSSSVISRFTEESLAWCGRNAISPNPSANLNSCITYLAQIQCKQSSQHGDFHASSYTSYHVGVSNNFLFYGVEDLDEMRQLQMLFDFREAEFQENEAKKFANALMSLVKTSKYDLKPVWPVGSSPPVRSGDRYDHDNYLRMNNTHFFTSALEEEAAKPLDSATLAVIETILNKCFNKKESQAEQNKSKLHLVSGWKKLDATRGVDFRLEANIGDKAGVSSQHCIASQLLATPQIIPMPFVTETFKISLIIPVTENDIAETMELIKKFAKGIIEKGDRIFLMLVFLYSPDRPDKNTNSDFFKEPKQLALQVSKKYKKKSKGSSHLLWYSMQTKGLRPSPLELVDLVTQKLDNRSIILIGSPNMEIRPDYFNRVRMNTIIERQVFCPVPFAEFHPHLAYAEGQRPKASIEFGLNTGHFDTLNMHHISFYKTDFLAARSLHETTDPRINHEKDLRDEKASRLSGSFSHNLCQMFQNSSGILHVLVAPEPSLRLSYEEVNCDIRALPEHIYQTCLHRRTRSFGTRAQLASLVLNSKVSP